MSYLEQLPENCPPSESEEVSEPREVFRLVQTTPPTWDDFRSQRAERPNARFRHVTECQARGLSVHTERKDSEKALKLPSLRGRLICRVKLNAGAGRILQTSTPSHHTWWPLHDFNILAHCTMETV